MSIRWLLMALLLLVATPGCGEQGPGSPGLGPVETGDLDALLEQGVLRVIVPGTALGEPSLPRRGSPVAQQRELAESFANSLGLRMELVPVFRLGEMLPLLEEGRADIIAANLTVTPARQERVDFSLPIDHVYEVVLVAAANGDIHAVEDLEGRSVMVDRASSFWETLTALREDHPEIHLLPGLDHFDDESTLDMLVAGQIDATVRDSNIAEMYLSYRDDLRLAFPLGERQAIAWAVRPETPQLLAALNRFLTMEQLTRPREARFVADLPGLRERRRLRILLPNTAASYFLWRGELVGFEYEFARRFAEEHRMRLEVVVPPHQEVSCASGAGCASSCPIPPPPIFCGAVSWSVSNTNSPGALPKSIACGWRWWFRRTRKCCSPGWKKDAQTSQGGSWSRSGRDTRQSASPIPGITHSRT